MLKATLVKNPNKNGYELRLFETISDEAWDFLNDQMGMNWFYSKTEKNPFNGKRLTILYRSYDLDKPQNHKGDGRGEKPHLKYSPEEAYKILEKKLDKAFKLPTTKTKTTAKATTTKTTTAKTKTTVTKSASKSKSKTAPKAETKKPLEKMTKAELIKMLNAMA